MNWDPATQSVTGIDQIGPAFVKRDEIAWIGTHRHAPEGNEIYVASYIFKYAVDLPAGTRAIHVPANDKLRILAATAVNEPTRLSAAGTLYAHDIKEPASPAPVRPVAAEASVTPVTSARPIAGRKPQ